jgi:signal transduction histidine kinase
MDTREGKGTDANGRESDRERRLLPFGAGPKDDDEALRRRLSRVALDLHDGALQDVAALLADVRFFRSRAEHAPNGEVDLETVVGLLDDLEARLIHVDDGLRRLIRGEPVTGAVGGVRQAITEHVSEFETRTGIQTSLEIEGDFEGLSPSQQIALFRIVQTALANVVQHTTAEHVDVRLRRDVDGVDAEVLDDGGGFDFDEALLKGVREGRLGLAGIAGRVRLLGGDVSIESAEGGGTKIAVRLPEWPRDEA